MHLRDEAEFPWIMSYDRAFEIVMLYCGLRQVSFDLEYSARERRTGRELLISKRLTQELGKSRTQDVTDASVVALAIRCHADIVSDDARDIRQLLAAARAKAVLLIDV